MEPIFPKWTNRIPLVIGILLPVIAIGAIGFVWYFFSPKFTDVGYTPHQPVPFSHQLHAGELGMDCRYCHNTVERSWFAAIPPTQTCMGCHTTVRPDSEKLAVVRESFEKNTPIPWVKVHMLPDYVRFDHRPHINSGVGCVECHGRVDQMQEVRQEQPMSMSWCLDCHRNPTERLRPKSEVTNMLWNAKDAQYNPHNDPMRTFDVNPPQNCSACHY